MWTDPKPNDILSVELRKGTVEIKLTAINPRPVLDVLVLSKDPNFSEAALRKIVASLSHSLAHLCRHWKSIHGSY